MKGKQQYTIELFFNDGDIKKQENFLIYPKSLDEEDYQELLETICALFEQEFRNAGIHQVYEIEKRLKENYDGKHIAIVAHKAPQLAFQVITEGKTWEEAIKEDWRKTKNWQPGWTYKLQPAASSGVLIGITQ